MPTRRLLVRTVWLALPVTITLLVLAVFNHLTIRAALLAWVLGLVSAACSGEERGELQTRGGMASRCGTSRESRWSARPASWSA